MTDNANVGVFWEARDLGLDLHRYFQHCTCISRTTSPLQAAKGAHASCSSRGAPHACGRHRSCDDASGLPNMVKRIGTDGLPTCERLVSTRILRECWLCTEAVLHLNPRQWYWWTVIDHRQEGLPGVCA